MRSLAALALAVACATARAQEPEEPERWSLSGWAGGAVQLPTDDELGDAGGALLLRPDVEYRPSAWDTLHVTLGLSTGDGVNDQTPFLYSPWAADLEAGTRDINGSGRDYLLTAWYRRAFALAGGELNVTGGVIDATEYLDRNAFSNDELSQFMNAALVNGPNGIAPSYDLGGALEWSRGDWQVNGVAMRVTQNEAGNAYGFFGLQGGLRSDLSIGEGHYRLYIGATTADYPDPEDDELESRRVAILSADQQLGGLVGLWTRTGIQAREAAVDQATTVSGGVHLSGRLWSREEDELGLGAAWLGGGNTGVEESLVLEGYVRFGLTERLALTLDVQRLRDRYEPGAGEDVAGWIVGLRLGYAF